MLLKNTKKEYNYIGLVHQDIEDIFKPILESKRLSLSYLGNKAILKDVLVVRKGSKVEIPNKLLNVDLGRKNHTYEYESIYGLNILRGHLKVKQSYKRGQFVTKEVLNLKSIFEG
jgi:hypothetical protein